MPQEDIEITENTEANGGLMAFIESLMTRHRYASNLVIHNVLFALAFFLSFVLRLEVAAPGERTGNWVMMYFLPALPFVLVVKSTIYSVMKLFHGQWRYASTRDVWRIVWAGWWFVLVTFAFVMLTYYLPGWFIRNYQPPYNYSRGVVLLDYLVSVLIVCTARLGVRLYREELRPQSREGIRRVLVVGAGSAAETLIREIGRMAEERYRVVGLVDDDPNKQGMYLHDLKVMGTTADIPEICQEHEIDEILIAMPSASQRELRRVVELCRGTNLKFKTMPGVDDLIKGRFTVSQIHEVDINDLLGREVVDLDKAAVERFIEGRRVLITGAGGSIGSEMCRQAAEYNPAMLILVEQAETPLFDIENELARRWPDLPRHGVICDIYDRDRVDAVFELHKPEVVIHAAAHKHVPLMERNPSEALKNNVFGTKNIADAASKHGAAEFVMISTDKAVNPSSIMGCSKRVAELYCQTLNGRDGCSTQYKAVRFGNVLGSSGSVVPIFKRQIAEGGPVRVTHPEMTRYFMTIPEASQLVLQAAATGVGGQIFLLDMGEPVKIVDLARDLITLSGFRPDVDIEIEFMGVRPGEKLFEELRTEGENIEPTTHPKVRVWRTERKDWQAIQRGMEGLASLANSNDRGAIIDALRVLVPEYEPLNPPEKIDAEEKLRRQKAAMKS